MNYNIFDQFTLINLNSTIPLMFVVILLLLLLIQFKTLKSTKIIVILELLNSHFRQLINNKGVFVILLSCLFLTLAYINILSLFSYTMPLTAHFALSCGLSFSIMIAATIMGFINHKLGYLSMLCPLGAPLFMAPFLIVIESISYFIKAISLGVRLAANISAGHLLMAILAGYVFNFLVSFIVSLITSSIIILIFITILEIAVALIQAYVFTLLTSIYISDAINLH
tara:strand:+ start:59 stop:736 length:678 start_codon:yes stop_codon:yes gene_type:complete